MPTTKEWTSIISTLYFYVMYAIAAVMISVGGYNLIQWGVKSFVFDEYPLGYDESRCEYMLDGPKYIDARPVEAPQQETDPEEQQKQYQRCLTQLEKERSIRQITDFSRGLGLVTVGLGLFFAHKFMEKNRK